LMRDPSDVGMFNQSDVKAGVW